MSWLATLIVAWRVSVGDIHLWFLTGSISFVCTAVKYLDAEGRWSRLVWWSGSAAASLLLHPSDHLHGLGGREGAGLRSGPNVLTKVPRSEGILALQVLCTSRKRTPRLPSLHFSRLCLRFCGWIRFFSFDANASSLGWWWGDLPLLALSCLRCIDLPLDGWCH